MKKLQGKRQRAWFFAPGRHFMSLAKCFLANTKIKGILLKDQN